MSHYIARQMETTRVFNVTWEFVGVPMKVTVTLCKERLQCQNLYGPICHVVCQHTLCSLFFSLVQVIFDIFRQRKLSRRSIFEEM